MTNLRNFYLINFSNFSSSVVYSDQLFSAARSILNILSRYTVFLLAHLTIDDWLFLETATGGDVTSGFGASQAVHLTTAVSFFKVQNLHVHKPVSTGVGCLTFRIFGRLLQARHTVAGPGFSRVHSLQIQLSSVSSLLLPFKKKL